MNELILFDNNEQTISARRLYDVITNKTERFNNWFNRQVSFGFTENEDFTSVKNFTVVNNGAKRNIKDYNLSIDMAKHICMIQKTDKAKEVRQYLIDLEKKWNSPEQVMARALKLADKTIEELKQENQLILIEKEQAESERDKAIEENKEKNKQLKHQQPFVDFAMKVQKSDDLITVNQMAKILTNYKMNVGSRRLFKWLREEKILMDNNTPYQTYMNADLFRVKETTKIDGYGKCRIFTVTMITGKGQIFILRKFYKWYQKENAEGRIK